MIVEGVFVEKALSELIRGWTAWSHKKAAKKILAEALLREIRFNSVMLYEAKNISSEERLGFDAPIFLRKMQTLASEIFFSSVFHLGELFKGSDRDLERKARFSDRNLIRAYHRQ